MRKWKSMLVGSALLAALSAAAAVANAYYDGNGNVIYVYVAPDGTIVY